MTRGGSTVRGAFFIAAFAWGGCGDTKPPKSVGAARVAEISTLLRKERDDLTTLYPAAAGSGAAVERVLRARAGALDIWLGSAAASDAAASEQRLVSDGETLLASAGANARLIQILEAFLPAKGQALKRRAALEEAKTELAACAETNVGARIEAWNEGFRTAEAAFARGLAALLSDPGVDPDRIQDLKIAAGGFMQAEAVGKPLYDEIAGVAVEAATTLARRALIDGRAAWAKRVATAAGDSAPVAALTTLAAFETFRSEELPSRMNDVLKSLGATAPDARAKAAELAADADRRLDALTAAFRPLAESLSLEGPPR